MEDPVKAHYGSDRLETRLFQALETAGKDPDSLGLKDLAPVDQLHTGGMNATVALVEQAGLKPGATVLDAGCGIGGSSRLMAGQFEFTVTGVDLSDRFIQVAKRLTGRQLLPDRLGFRSGSVLDLPFEKERFDAVLCQHVLMNVRDKNTSIKEFSRVLRAGGKLIFHEIVKGGRAPILYPVPWAEKSHISFVEPWDTLRPLLKTHGFKTEYYSDGTQKAAEWWNRVKQAAEKRDPLKRVLGPHLIFGENAALFGKTMCHNLEKDRIRVVEAVYIKRG